MKNHQPKDLLELADVAQKNFGCRVERNGHALKVFPPKEVTDKFYTCHITGTAYHPLRRFLKNVCKFQIE